MRDIIFRGKRVDNGEWVKGSLINYGTGKAEIHTPIDRQLETGKISSGLNEVIPESVGQYTGLEDKNGKKIFEGDIVTHFSNYLAKRINKAVTFEDGSFMSGEAFLIDWVKCGGVEIIGNIHDNPELLK